MFCKIDESAVNKFFTHYFIIVQRKKVPLSEKVPSWFDVFRYLSYSFTCLTQLTINFTQPNGLFPYTNFSRTMLYIVEYYMKSCSMIYESENTQTDRRLGWALIYIHIS